MQSAASAKRAQLARDIAGTLLCLEQLRRAAEQLMTQATFVLKDGKRVVAPPVPR